jgi:hypothetical protein
MAFDSMRFFPFLVVTFFGLQSRQISTEGEAETK